MIYGKYVLIVDNLLLVVYLYGSISFPSKIIYVDFHLPHHFLFGYYYPTSAWSQRLKTDLLSQHVSCYEIIAPSLRRKMWIWKWCFRGYTHTHIHTFLSTQILKFLSSTDEYRIVQGYVLGSDYSPFKLKICLIKENE